MPKSTKPIEKFTIEEMAEDYYTCLVCVAHYARRTGLGDPLLALVTTRIYAIMDAIDAEFIRRGEPRPWTEALDMSQERWILLGGTS